MTQALVGGCATFDVGMLNAGDHSLAASYAPLQANFEASSASATLHVEPAMAFSDLTAATIILGTRTTAVSGRLTSAGAVPAGQTVSISVGAGQRPRDRPSRRQFCRKPVDRGDADGAYTIDYHFAGSENFSSVDGSGSLDVTYDIADNLQLLRSGGTLQFVLALTDNRGKNVTSPTLTVHGGFLVPLDDPSQTHLPVPATGNSQPGGNFKYVGRTEEFSLNTSGLAPGVYELFFTISGDPVEHYLTFRVQPKGFLGLWRW